MTELITFPGGQAQKDALVAAIAADKAADRLVKGTYGKLNGEFRGCAVGCTIFALEGREAESFSDHSAYERLIGVPKQIAMLEDVIFEGLPPDEAMAWPERFTAAIPVGVDLRPAFHRFMAWMLDDPERGVIRFADERVAAAIKTVADLHRKEVAGRDARAAAGDARAAAWAAMAAAMAAARAAVAAWAAGDAYRSFADRLILEMESQADV